MEHGWDNGCPETRKGASVQVCLEFRLQAAKRSSPPTPLEGGIPNCGVAICLAPDTGPEKGIAT
jgi:hypothetical protein